MKIAQIARLCLCSGCLFSVVSLMAQEKTPIIKDTPLKDTPPRDDVPVIANSHLALDPTTGRILYYYSLDQNKPALTRIPGAWSFERLVNRGFEAIAADYLYLDSEGDEDGSAWQYLKLPDIGLMEEFWVPIAYSRSTKHRKPISSFYMNPGQFMGVECPIWRLGSRMPEYWVELGRRLKTHNRDFLLYTEYPEYRAGNLPSPLKSTYIRITPQRYLAFEKMAKDPALAGGIIRDQLSAPSQGKKVDRALDSDFEEKLLFDPDSGRIFLYWNYRNDDPANVDVHDGPWIASLIYGIKGMSRRMFMDRQGKGEDSHGGALKSTEEEEGNGECIVFPNTFYGTGDEKWAMKESEAEKEILRHTKPGNWMTFYPGTAFGEQCFIWDLKIWPLLGRRLAEQKQPYILYTGGTENDPRLLYAPLDITKVPRDLAVLVDLDLYHRMEALRKAYLEPRDRGNDAFEGDDPDAE